MARLCRRARRETSRGLIKIWRLVSARTYPDANATWLPSFLRLPLSTFFLPTSLSTQSVNDPDNMADKELHQSTSHEVSSQDTRKDPAADAGSHGLLNASGHVQELNRNFSLWSLAGVGLSVGNVWPAIGGSILVAIYNGGPPGKPLLGLRAAPVACVNNIQACSTSSSLFQSSTGSSRRPLPNSLPPSPPQPVSISGHQ